MDILKYGLILSLFFCSAFICACNSSANTNAANANATQAANTANDDANAVKSSVEELGLQINVPYEAEDITWKEDAQYKKLIAVLRFSPADSNKLVAEAEKVKQPLPVTITLESWFPDELIAQSEMNGDDSLKGVALAADSFYRAPYTDGRITRIEGTDYFVLELFAK